MANTQVTKILTKEMDRKDFLKYSSGVFLGVIGVTGLVSTLTKLSDGTPKTASTQGGYGASAYGK